jgi:hypothetical protein
MSRASRSRICAAGFMLGCVALLVLGMPERLGEASSQMPGWGRAMLSFTIMGLTSSVVVLAWITLASRMLEWTRMQIARVESRQG